MVWLMLLSVPHRCISDLSVDKVSSENVMQGMRLTKDPIRPDGVLRLTLNTGLADLHIQKIQQLESAQKTRLELWASKVENSPSN